MNNRVRILTLCAAVCLLLSGCVQNAPSDPGATLPPVVLNEKAPTGDLQENHFISAPLYLLTPDASAFVPVEGTVSVHPFRWPCEELVRQLLNARAEGFSSLPGSGKLTLAGVNPIEISCGIATVNLSSSALTLAQDDLLTVCQAIAHTLCAADGIHAVNVLVGNVQPGLDIAGTTPAGTLTADESVSIPVLRNRAETRRISVQEKQRITINVTLYFPADGAEGILAETQTLNLSSSSPSEMMTELLQALSSGPASVGGLSYPSLTSHLETAPALFEAGGEKYVRLALRDSISAALEEAGIPLNLFCAGLVYTLTTFMPGVAGAEISVGGEPIRSLPSPEGAPEKAIAFSGGHMRRAGFSRFVLDEITLYGTLDGETLFPCRKAVPWAESRNPRTIFEQLLENTDGYASPLPEGLSTGDLLGVELGKDEDILLMNFSSHLLSSIRRMDDSHRRTALYSVINSMIDGTKVSRIALFFDGAQPEIPDMIDFTGTFMKNVNILQPASTGG